MKLRNIVFGLVVGALCVGGPAFGQTTKKGTHKVGVLSKMRSHFTHKTPFRPGTMATHGPLTKKGKPDMRYKANKAHGPLTKSGKPDMRYKANNPNAGKHKKTHH